MNMVKLDSVQIINSLEFRSMINSMRDSSGEAKIRNDQFIARIEDEIDDLGACKIIAHPQNGSDIKTYDLTIDQAMLIGMRESKAVRRAVCQQLKEMARRSVPALPTFPELLRQHADALEQLALAAPAVEFVDKFVHASTGSMGFREVCKLLSVNEATFRKFLEKEKIIYKLNGGKTPYANHLDAGRFETKAGINSQTGRAFNAYRFTTKGVEWVAGEFAKWQLRGGL